jgi:hypothetical protein
LNGVVFLHRAELIALDKTRSIAWAETVASISRVTAALPSAILRAWVVPIGFLISGAVRWGLFSKLLKGAYREVTHPISTASAAGDR